MARGTAAAWSGLILLSLGSLGCDELAKGARRALSRPSPRPSVVPPSPSNRSGREDEDRVLAWARRNMSEAYSRVGQRDPRWDAKVQDLIEGSLLRHYKPQGPDDSLRVLAVGRDVVALGCSDPLVLYALALALREEDPDSQEAAFLLQKALEGMKRTRYPRAVARYVASVLYRTLEYCREPVGARKPLANQELQWFVESLQDGSYEPDEDDVLVWQLTNGTGEAMVARNSARVKLVLEGTAWLDEWARLYFAGFWHEKQAWAARGHDVAAEVRPEQWKGYRSELALARRDWVRAWELRPDRPEAAFAMISTDLVESDETSRLWFDRAVAARVDYGGAYTTLLRVLRPRWGGSYEEMLAFGKECLAGGRFDTVVPLYLVDAVDEIAKDQKDEVMGEGGTPIYEVPETFDLLARMLDGYLAAPSPPLHPDFIHSLYAVVAGTAGRYEVAREHLQAVGFRIHPVARWRIPERRDEFVNRVAALGGPAGATARQADAAREKGATLEALSLYRRALTQDKQPQAQRYLRDRIGGLEQEQALARGGWVDFLPSTSTLDGWEALGGSFQRDKDGGLLATSGGRGYLLVSRARVGSDFELTARLEFVSSTNDKFEAGIVFGWPHWDRNEWTTLRVFQTTSEGRTASLSQHLYDAWSTPVPLAQPSPSEVVLRVVGGRVTAQVNGLSVAQDQLPPQGHVDDPGARVGFGAYFDDHNQFSVRYRNVRVRLLPRSGSRAAAR